MEEVKILLNQVMSTFIKDSIKRILKYKNCDRVLIFDFENFIHIVFNCKEKNMIDLTPLYYVSRDIIVKHDVTKKEYNTSIYIDKLETPLKTFNKLVNAFINVCKLTKSQYQ
jgi:hypothetical protein